MSLWLFQCAQIFCGWARGGEGALTPSCHAPQIWRGLGPVQAVDLQYARNLIACKSVWARAKELGLEAKVAAARPLDWTIDMRSPNRGVGSVIYIIGACNRKVLYSVYRGV